MTSRAGSVIDLVTRAWRSGGSARPGSSARRHRPHVDLADRTDIFLDLGLHATVVILVDQVTGDYIRDCIKQNGNHHQADENTDKGTHECFVFVAHLNPLNFNRLIGLPWA
jgi:hypothetical protein